MKVFHKIPVFFKRWLPLLDHDELSCEEFKGKDDVRDEDSKNNQGQGRLNKYEYDDD